MNMSIRPRLTRRTSGRRRGSDPLSCHVVVAADWPRIDKHAALVIPSRRYTLRVAGSADLVAIVNTRPTRIVLIDDCRVIGMRVTVRCGCEAERQACAERGLDDDEGDGAIHVWFQSGWGCRGRTALMWNTLHDQQRDGERNHKRHNYDSFQGYPPTGGRRPPDRYTASGAYGSGAHRA